MRKIVHNPTTQNSQLEPYGLYLLNLFSPKYVTNIVLFPIFSYNVITMAT